MIKYYPQRMLSLILIMSFHFISTEMQAQMDLATEKAVSRIHDVTKIHPDKANNAHSEANNLIFSYQGTGKLENGSAKIMISPEIIDQIDGARIEDKLEVMIQLDGQCNGVYINKKSRNFFAITELYNGTSSTNFSYQVFLRSSN